MLYYAAHMDTESDDQEGLDLDRVMNDPGLAKYVQGWGRPGDLGYVAEDSTGKVIGAAWIRLFVGADKAYSLVDDSTPELAIAIAPGYRGQGIGGQLMGQLLHEAAGRYATVALNVRADNPAVQLYQRLGFEVVGELVNRVGAKSYDMRWHAPQVNAHQ
jgi:ribosomal protein S18 acetylase RimI-like enzyme